VKTFLSTILIAALSLCVFNTVDAATLSFLPASPKVSVGDIVSVLVMVSTGGTAVNNAEGTILFPPDLLEVESINKSSSIFNLWIEEPEFSNYSGKISWNGGLPNPGFSGDGGEIMSVTFRAKSAGTASVMFSDPAVLANDGLGTNVLSGQSGAQITISAAPAKAAAKGPASTMRTGVSAKAIFEAGTMVVNYLSIIFLGVILLAALAAVIVYSYHKLRQLHRKMRRMVSETEREVHKSFYELEKEMAGHFDMLKSAKNKRELTREEKIIMDSLHKRFETAEKDIDKSLNKIKKK